MMIYKMYEPVNTKIVRQNQYGTVKRVTAETR